MSASHGLGVRSGGSGSRSRRNKGGRWYDRNLRELGKGKRDVRSCPLGHIFVTIFYTFMNFVTAELAATVERRRYPDLNLIEQLCDNDKVMRGFGINRESSLGDGIIKEDDVYVEAVFGGRKVKDKVREDGECVERVKCAIGKSVGGERECRKQGRGKGLKEWRKKTRER